MGRIGQELLDVPFAEMVKSVGKGIAEAQYELDQISLKIAQMMGQKGDAHKVNLGSRGYSLLELGFTPTFYQFIDTTLEVRMTINMKTSYRRDGSYSIHAGCTSVNASYSGKYQYSVEGSSLMRTKLVPVPAPAALEERIMAMIEEEEEDTF